MNNYIGYNMKMDLKNPDVLALTQELVRMETISANYRELPALEEIAELMTAAGFTCSMVGYDPKEPGRANLIAELNPGDPEPALCMGGHIDTVPFGLAEWMDDPLAAVVKDGKLYGRGAADMKGGLAAIICAALNYAGRLNGRNLIVHAYGGEELGLLGSRYLALHKPEVLRNVGAVVVAEPTSNRPQFGHKGVTWFELSTKGVTAHAAMPEQGDNALVKLLPGAARLCNYQPSAEHPHLGKSTLVLAVLQSGLNGNSVPDSAVLKMDLRTVAGQDIDKVAWEIREIAQVEGDLAVTADIPPLWTDPEHPWCQKVLEIVSQVSGVPATPGVAQFATDASALRLHLKDAPMVVLGPGDQNMAHKTDEFVPVQELYDAQRIYEGIIEDWYKA